MTCDKGDNGTLSVSFFLPLIKPANFSVGLLVSVSDPLHIPAPVLLTYPSAPVCILVLVSLSSFSHSLSLLPLSHAPRLIHVSLLLLHPQSVVS